MSLMRTKPIDPNAQTGLKRCLTAFDLTLLGIGCIIGTGIFVLTGVAAAQNAGPARFSLGCRDYSGKPLRQFFAIEIPDEFNTAPAEVGSANLLARPIVMPL